MTNSTDAGKPGNFHSRQVARSTLVVIAGFAFSSLLGLIRQPIIAAAFGTGAELDAFATANGIPELLFTILSGGALAFAFIPVYTEKLAHDRTNASMLFRQVITIITALAAVAALLTAVFAPVLVSASWGVAPHFSPETRTLTVQLMRILLITSVVFAASSILSGVLHAHQHFVLPALAPSMYTAGIILGALFLAPVYGIFGLAWGAVAGSVFHLLIQVPGLIRHGINWQPVFQFSNPALRRIAILMAPRVIDLFMARISIDWLNTNLGSALGEGRVSALRYAFGLMNIPWTFIGTAIGIAVFPTMAELAARKDMESRRNAVSGSLRAILTLSIPAATGLIMLGRPLVRVLFERGEFTAQSSELVFYALQFFALVLISQSMLEVVVRAFASEQDTYTPLYVSIFTTALNIGLAIWLSDTNRLSHGGLALANGVAVGIEAITGLIILHFRWKGINTTQIFRDAGKAILASLAMAGVIATLKAAVGGSDIVYIAVSAALGGMVYLAAAWVLGIREVATIPFELLSGARSWLRRATG